MNIGNDDIAIDWTQAPTDADGWMKQHGDVAWWRLPKDGETALVRIGTAPDFAPNESNVHSCRSIDAILAMREITIAT